MQPTFFRKKRFLLLLLIPILPAVLAIPANRLFEGWVRRQVLRSAREILQWEKNGYLSRDSGYVWAHIGELRKMKGVVRSMGIASPEQSRRAGHMIIRKGRRSDYQKGIPSLAAIRELNSVQRISNSIEIADRHGQGIAEIKTTNTRSKVKDLNDILIQSVIYAEDRNFFTRELAYEYRSFVRAALRSILHFFKTLEIQTPKGVSTIHQQVAKFLLAKTDSSGFAYVEKSLGRKWKELKLAQALKLMYSNEEILEVYLNDCVTAGKSFVGCVDLSRALFGKTPKDLDICQSLYISRLLKWNRNLPHKIIKQCKTDLPRIARQFGWSQTKQDSIKLAMDSIRIGKPKQIRTQHGPLVDLANEFWLLTCAQNGMTQAELDQMDLLNPSSLVRNKGNLRIRLTVDMRLQRFLEGRVKRRGFGDDTVVVTDIRIGSHGSNLRLGHVPPDTIRRTTVLEKDSSFSEPESDFQTVLRKGDTLIANIRYARARGDTVRRSVFHYRRGPFKKPGQYFAYAMMEAGTGKLLAYYSRDKLGSRIASLVRNRTPNGSAVAKPILHALALDLGTFSAHSMMTDSMAAGPRMEWHRRFAVKRGARTGVVYLRSSSPNGYTVHNHHDRFDGYDYYFNHLAESNNIIGVETIYRLNTALYGKSGKLNPEAVSMANLLYRLGVQEQYGPPRGRKRVSGVKLYSDIANLVGADDSVSLNRQRLPLPENYTSVALGTLELTLLQQMHLFNGLYQGKVIKNPDQSPALYLQSIHMSGREIAIPEKLRSCQLVSEMNRIRPALLGLHKRLTGNPYDRLRKYDIPLPAGQSGEDPFRMDEPLSNFAKSGTTDDILIPYDADPMSGKKTNYCLWNAVIRLALKKAGPTYSIPSLGLREISLSGKAEIETLDVTVACIGEGNRRTTGPRDGKTLHKYLTKSLLRKFGVESPHGFYTHYEKHLIRATPDSVKYRNPFEAANLDEEVWTAIRKTSSDSLPELPTPSFQQESFGRVRLTERQYLRMLVVGQYLGNAGKIYCELLEEMRSPQSKKKMLEQVELLEELRTGNKYTNDLLARRTRAMRNALARL